MFSIHVSALLLALVVAPAAPVQEPQHQHPARRARSSARCILRRRARAPRRPQFDRAMALLHSFEFGPAIEGFNARCKADPGCAMAHWGIALARWTNPFAATIRPPAQLQQGLDAISRASQAGAEDRARARLHRGRGEAVRRRRHARPARARRRRTRRRWPGSRPAYPDDREASIFWALSLTAVGAADRQDLRESAEGRRDSREALSPEQPDHPGHHALHHSQLRRAGAAPISALAAARRYAKIAPRRRTRCTCRRTRSRASAPGRIRSTPTSRRPTPPGRPTARAEELHAMDYMDYAYLQTGQDKAARTMLDGCRRSRRASIRTPSPAPRRDRPASSRWPRFRRAGRSSGATGAAAAAARSRQPSRFPYAEAMTLLRARARRRAHRRARRRARVDRGAAGDPRSARAGQRSLLGRTGRHPARRRGRVCSRSPKARSDEALATMRAAARARTPPRRTRSRRARSRRRASCSARCCSS